MIRVTGSTPDNSYHTEIAATNDTTLMKCDLSAYFATIIFCNEIDLLHKHW